MNIILKAGVFDAPLKQAIIDKLAVLKVTRDAITFDEIRAALGKDKSALPDGVIHQVALDAGYTVV